MVYGSGFHACVHMVQEGEILSPLQQASSDTYTDTDTDTHTDTDTDAGDLSAARWQDRACVQVVQEEEDALANRRLLHRILRRMQHLRGAALRVRVQH